MLKEKAQKFIFVKDKIYIEEESEYTDFYSKTLKVTFSFVSNLARELKKELWE